jgi:hypothetical protein
VAGSCSSRIKLRILDSAASNESRSLPTLAADAVRSFTGAANEVLKFIKGLRTKPTATVDQSNTLEKMIAETEAAAGVAQARVLHALGYQLCRCEIPPTAMLTVGYQNRGKDTGEPVHECPKCGRDTAAPFGFVRTVPKLAESRVAVE